MNGGAGGRTVHYGWVVVVLCVVVIIGALGFGRFGYTVVLPGMKSGLGLEAVQAADLATANMIGYLLFSVIGGVLSARFGARMVISFFMLVVSASMLLCGLARSYPAAVVARTLTGIGSAGANIPAMALVAVWFSRRTRGLATGIAVSGASIGLVVTGLVVPAIVAKVGPAGWRYAWFAFAAFTFLVAGIAFALLRNSPADLGLAPVGTREDRISQREVSDGVPGKPSLDWSLLYKSAQIWHLGGIYILFGFSYVIYATFFVEYLTSEAGFALARAGSLWSAIGSVSIVSGFLWGTVSDRLGRKYGLFLVLLVQAAAYCLFGLWRSVPGFYLSAGLFALTAWSVPAIMAAAAGDLLGAVIAAAAFGFISLLLSVGQALGPFIAGRIVSAGGSYSGAFVAASAAAALGAIAALFLKVKAVQE